MLNASGTNGRTQYDSVRPWYDRIAASMGAYRTSSARQAEQKGVDVRMALDLVRLGQKGLCDVAIVVSEDSDLNPAIADVYGLRDNERWIAVENALPYSDDRKPRWLEARRRRLIDADIFKAIRDTDDYSAFHNNWNLLR